MRTVCIDAGHAGVISDPGAVSSNGWLECQLNLAVAQALKQELVSRGYRVVMTRDSDECPLSDDLGYRTNIANKTAADIFISLHGNASPNTDAQGVEVYSCPGSEMGALLASCLLNELARTRYSRGLKIARFYVLRYTVMPAALVEMGFMSNAQEVIWLQEKTNQQEIAAALAAGIETYFTRSHIPTATFLLPKY